MRSENTFGVYFTVRKNKNKRADHSLVAVISCNNTPEKELTIKGSYDITNWDQGAGKPKLHSKPLREFATYLEKVKSKLTAIFQELELNECILSAENIKKHYLGKSEEQARVTMLELTKLAYAKYEKELKPGSLKNCGATNSYIERFCNFKYPAKDIPLRKRDFNFIDDLYSYILSNPIKPNEPCHKTVRHLNIDKPLGHTNILAEIRVITHTSFSLYSITLFTICSLVPFGPNTSAYSSTKSCSIANGKRFSYFIPSNSIVTVSGVAFISKNAISESASSRSFIYISTWPYSMSGISLLVNASVVTAVFK